MMYDRSPVGLNHWLGHKVRAMLARHVFRHCGNNVKIFHGVEFSFGYNLTVEDNCTIHKYVLLDDRGEIIIHEGSSVSDYANIYSHAHDLNDGMIINNHRTEIGPRARITYHATVLSGVRVGEHGMVGSMGVASKDVDPFTVVGGIPAKPIKVKSIAFMFAISVHESAHAWMANLRGDPTARMLGRITLNPIKHIDPVGTLLLPAVAMLAHLPVLGWAKPTP